MFCYIFPAIQVLLLHTTGVAAQIFESCSSLNASRGVFTLPNLPNLGDLNSRNIASMVNEVLRTDDVVIYPVPAALNCSGTISAIEYCYQAPTSRITLGSSTHVFRLLILELVTEEQHRTTFEISDTFSVSSTPTDQICTNRNFHFETYRFCCDSLQLHTTITVGFPSSNLAFGIVVSDLQLNPVILPHDNQLVGRFRFPHISTVMVGETVTVANSNFAEIVEYRVIRFLIQPEAAPQTTSLIAMETTTEPVPTTAEPIGTTGTLPVTTEFTEEHFSEATTALLQSTSNEFTPTTAATAQTTNGFSIQRISLLAGSSAGAFTAVLISVVIIGIAVRRHYKKRKFSRQRDLSTKKVEDESELSTNALYCSSKEATRDIEYANKSVFLKELANTLEVTFSTNQAYGATSENNPPENEYDYPSSRSSKPDYEERQECYYNLHSPSSLFCKRNEAYDAENKAMQVSTNRAYGVINKETNCNNLVLP